jgi:hypothetical protein
MECWWEECGSSEVASGLPWGKAGLGGRYINTQRLPTQSINCRSLIKRLEPEVQKLRDRVKPPALLLCSRRESHLHPCPLPSSTSLDAHYPRQALNISHLSHRLRPITELVFNWLTVRLLHLTSRTQQLRGCSPRRKLNSCPSRPTRTAGARLSPMPHDGDGYSYVRHGGAGVRAIHQMQKTDVHLHKARILGLLPQPRIIAPPTSPATAVLISIMKKWSYSCRQGHLD